ncbi:MAG: hypothetical protein AAFZ17_07940 [Cyanobacteria bacterium J06650_10]
MIWNELTVEAERPGWLTFKLSNQGIWYWLEQFQRNAHSTKPKHTLFINQLSPSSQHPSSSETILETTKIMDSARCSKSHPQFLAPSSPPPLIQPSAQSLTQSSAKTKKAETPSSKQPTAKHRPFSAPPESDVVTQHLWQAQYTFSCCCSLIRQSQAVHKAIHKRNSAPSQVDSVAHESSTRWALISGALISEIVATVDSICIDATPSRAGAYPPAEAHSPHDPHIQQTLIPLKQSALLCKAFDTFYRVDWPQTQKSLRMHSTDSSDGKNSKRLKLLIATKEALRILLHQYEAQVSDSI